MAFWSGAKLEHDGPRLQIVDGFEKKQIDCSAYTLRMGAEAYVTPSHGFDLRKNTKQKLEFPQPPFLPAFGKWYRARGGDFVIPPGQFAFLLTEETVKIPPSTMGFISLKSGTKFKGLINVSGFHVDPGFTGKLIYSVFNAGPSPIHLSRGDDLFLLWIADLVGDEDPDYTKTTKDNAPAQLEIPSKLISEVARETHSLQALSDRVEQLSVRVTTFRILATGAATGLSLALTIVTLIFAWPSFEQWLQKQ